MKSIFLFLDSMDYQIVFESIFIGFIVVVAVEMIYSGFKNEKKNKIKRKSGSIIRDMQEKYRREKK